MNSCSRSSHIEVFCKNCLLKNFAKFTGEKQLTLTICLVSHVSSSKYAHVLIHLLYSYTQYKKFAMFSFPKNYSIENFIV